MKTLDASAETTAFDVARVRADFPVLERTGRSGRPLVYLDSAATAQKPHAVIEAEADFYRHHNAAVHRGAHLLAEESTAAYEGARATIARFIGGQHGELVLTRNATEALNLLAYSLGNASIDPTADPRLRLGPGDEVCVTEMEHHANLVPWQELCRRTGATLRWIPLAPDGTLDLRDLDTLVNERTKVLSFVHQSNVVGTINPVEVLRDRARAVGALVFLDACQSVPHRPIDVVALGVDAVELHTGPYALAKRQEQRTLELARLSEAGRVTSSHGMRLHAGHGLNYNNVRPVAEIPNMIELNIGHSIISRAVMIGMREAVAQMRNILDLVR